MTNLPFDSRDLLDPGANWCPDCGLPRGVCDCEEIPECQHDVRFYDEDLQKQRCARCGETLPLKFYELTDMEDWPGGVAYLHPKLDGAKAYAENLCREHQYPPTQWIADKSGDEWILKTADGEMKLFRIRYVVLQ